MKTIMKSIKKFSLMLACCLSLSPTAVYAGTDAGPIVNFEYCGIADVPDRTGPDGYQYRCLQNDLFYIEYPGSWVFGSDKTCPIMFYKSTEGSSTSNKFQTFEDEHLIGDADTIDRYIKNGGIDSYLRSVIGDTTGGQFILRENESTIMFYGLVKDGEQIASIIVWGDFGKLDIRDERSYVTVNPANDYGEILVFPVWDSTDFSSAEAIQSYVSGGGLSSRLSAYASDIVCEVTAYNSDSQSYVVCKDERDSTNFAAYIPVTPSNMKKWIVVFTASKESQMSFNAYTIQEEIMKTFKVLK